MRLIEIPVLILILQLCFKTFSSGCTEFLKIQETLAPIEKSLQQDSSISSSFEKLCSESIKNGKPLGGKKISEWKETCRSFLCDEEEINVVCLGFFDDKTLLKCEWKDRKKINSVFQVASAK